MISKSIQISQKILVTLSSLSDNETWWQIWISKPNCSTLKNLVLMVIPNHFGKHVNRTSQIKIVIYKKICCLKRINFYRNKRMLLKFSINISDQLHRCQISLVDPRILKYHQGMTQLTLLLKNLPFNKVWKQ